MTTPTLGFFDSMEEAQKFLRAWLKNFPSDDRLNSSTGGANAKCGIAFKLGKSFPDMENVCVNFHNDMKRSAVEDFVAAKSPSDFIIIPPSPPYIKWRFQLAQYHQFDIKEHKEVQGFFSYIENI